MNNKVKNSLISILALLTHKAQDKNIEPCVISTEIVLDRLKRFTGMSMTYQQLSDIASSDPTISKFISSVNKHEITLNTGSEPTPEMEPHEDTEEGDVEGNPFSDESEMPTSPAMPPQAPQMPSNEPLVPEMPNPVPGMAKRAAKRS